MNITIEVPEEIIQKMESLDKQRKRLEVKGEHIKSSRSNNIEAIQGYEKDLEFYVRSLEEMLNDFYELLTEGDEDKKIERVANAVADAVQQPAKNSEDAEGS